MSFFYINAMNEEKLKEIKLAIDEPADRAPNLAFSRCYLIHNMIVSKSFTALQIADTAGCYIRGVKRFRSSTRFFGTMRAL
jgi:hypothetical protein